MRSKPDQCWTKANSAPKAAAADQKAKGNPWMERFAASYFGFQDKWVDASEIRIMDAK